ncbi:unnamed protein product [Polarella glacialis]|uniref:ABC transporter domain-containing protein n=1 Tax=Polarella glacialis TaxID=89957 RepID=A0A813DI65_POLGL|nr:unnamed protein product [Polarella glacialis]
MGASSGRPAHQGPSLLREVCSRSSSRGTAGLSVYVPLESETGDDEEGDETEEDFGYGGSRGPPGDGHDILQFTAPIYFVEEREGEVVIDIMRLGSMRGAVSVRWKTVDGSGKAGSRYSAASGKVLFQDGELMKSINVKVVDSELWAATLEFKVLLSEPEHCETGRYLHTCRVKVIDDDLFPTNKYKEQIEQGEEGIKEINGFGLIREFLTLIFHMDGLARSTLLTLVMDQLENLYLFCTLSAGIYMVDTVFNTTDEESVNSLLWHDRDKTVLVLGAVYIVPMLVLHAWHIIRIQLDMKGKVRLFLQANLFRKYLNYSEDSREKVCAADIQGGIFGDSAGLAEGFMSILQILKLAGKLVVLTSFALRSNPDALRWVLIMPSLMLLFGICRHKLLYDANEMAGSMSADLVHMVQQAASNYRLISNYAQRPLANEEFAKKSAQCREKELPAEIVKANNAYFPKWLGALFVGVYIIDSARDVIHGELSLGVFLATIGIFQQISSDFAEGYLEMMNVSESISPLQTLTVLLNMATDVRSWKAVNRSRRAQTVKLRDAMWSEAATSREKKEAFKDDLIPIELDKVTFRSRSGGAGVEVFSETSASVEQGRLVAVTGHHGTGKTTLLRMVAHEIFPNEGRLFVPTHLRILHVSQEIMMLDQSPWNNLIFGCSSPSDIDPIRIRLILTKLRMKKTMGLIKGDLELAAQTKPELHHRTGDEARGLCACMPADWEDSDDDEESSETQNGSCGHEAETEQEPRNNSNSWQKTLAYSERARIHLARALIMNPEVMVLQRPLHHYNVKAASEALTLLKEHVRNRGVGWPEETAAKRRPRIVFFTAESPQQEEEADVCWEISEDRKIQVSQKNFKW